MAPIKLPAPMNLQRERMFVVWALTPEIYACGTDFNHYREPILEYISLRKDSTLMLVCVISWGINNNKGATREKPRGLQETAPALLARALPLGESINFERIMNEWW
jgi:hypothetical protein